MRFIADMCIDVRVATWLNAQGHDAIHLRDQGLQRLANGEIFDNAIAESDEDAPSQRRFVKRTAVRVQPFLFRNLQELFMERPNLTCGDRVNACALHRLQPKLVL